MMIDVVARANYFFIDHHQLFCSFLDTKDQRYTMKMFPVIPKEKWRKGSQVIFFISYYFEINFCRIVSCA